MQCFRSFHAAGRTIEGIEAVHVMRRGQVKRLDGRDATGQAKFVVNLFDAAAQRKLRSKPSCFKVISATQRECLNRSCAVSCRHEPMPSL